MNRPDVLLLILPIILVLAWHSRLIHKYGWQSELCEEEPTREPSWGRRPAAERPLASAPTSQKSPGASSSQSPGWYYAPVTLDEPSLDADTFDGWRKQART